jgi:hypothetical protein
VIFHVGTIADLIVRERRLEPDPGSQPTRCFAPEKPMRCQHYGVIKFRADQADSGGRCPAVTLDALPILLTLC